MAGAQDARPCASKRLYRSCFYTRNSFGTGRASPDSSPDFQGDNHVRHRAVDRVDLDFAGSIACLAAQPQLGLCAERLVHSFLGGVPGLVADRSYLKNERAFYEKILAAVRRGGAAAARLQ